MTARPTTDSSGSDGPDEDSSKKDGAKTSLATLIFHHSITVLILLLFVVLGAWGYLNLHTTEFFGTIDRAALEAQLQPTLETAQQQRLHHALEVYALLHDRYPSQFGELVNAGLLLPSDPYYPRGPDGWLYEPHSEGFTLEMRSHEDSHKE